QGDAHVLVPGEVVGVVGGGDPERVALADAHSPVGAGGAQREVPGDRAGGLVVARLGAGDPDRVRGRARGGAGAGRRAVGVGEARGLAAAGGAARERGAGADELDGVVEPAGVDVSDRAHDRAVDRQPHLVERGVSAVGVLGVGRIGEGAALAAAAAAVADRVVLAYAG